MWKYLGPKLKPYGHFERIESHETAVGTPDVNYCIEGYCNNLELKYTEKEKGCVLRASQSGWFRKRCRAKGQPWLLLCAHIRQTRGWCLIPGTDVPGLVHTRDVKDWLRAGIMVWEEKIIIEQLVEFLSIYLKAQKEDSNGHPEEESSGLILPSTKLTN
jgi:hypothetical protein